MNHKPNIIKQNHFAGEDVSPDKAIADSYLMNAAENGLPEAQFEYAKVRKKGGKNEKTAFLIVPREDGFAGAFKQLVFICAIARRI